MANRHRRNPWFTPLLLFWMAGSVFADQALITIDDAFSDWAAIAVAHVDPTGDSGGGEIDFGNLWLADDSRFLFLRVELGLEIDASENNDLRLYLDTDADSGTGLAVAGIGAELEWRFGTRNGTFHMQGQTSLFHDDIRFRQAPSVTTDEIEFAVGRDTLPDGVNPLFTGSQIRVALIDVAGSDQVPDSGQFVNYTLDQGNLPPDPDLPLVRESPGDLRVITYNVLNDAPWEPGLEPRFGRQLAAVSPDILNFQEIRDHSAAETVTLVSSWVPLGAGETWSGADNNDCITVTRYPILGSWPLDGNLAVLIDTTSVLQKPLLQINAHFPCCANDTDRQFEIDRVMAFIRDAKEPGGSLTLDPDTPILVSGDMNLVGSSQQLTTLLTGDIVNPQFAPDFTPDWDGSDFSNLISRQTEKRMGYTWRSDTSSFWPGHLDYHIYSDSVLALGNHFIIYTPEMVDPAQHGLQANDSTASDHLLFCVDFRLPSTSALTTSPPDGGVLAFGPVRVGQSAAQTLSATNTGDPGSNLSGTFPAATTPFSPDVSQGFGPLDVGQNIARDYFYTPTQRGLDSDAVTVTSNGGDSTVGLDGQGVGPVFGSNRTPGSMIDLGTVSGFSSNRARLQIRNLTGDPDGGDPTRTELTLTAASIQDTPRMFSLSGFAPGTVLAPGESVTLTIQFHGSPFVSAGVTTAELQISTDVGAAPGGAGASYSFGLRGRNQRRSN